MKLPSETLRLLIADPEAPSTHACAIAVLCCHCMKIERHTLGPDSPDDCGEDHLVPQGRISGVRLAARLKCDEETCKARLPLIVVWDPATTREPLAANADATFPWGDLTCPSGHPIPFPQSR